MRKFLIIRFSSIGDIVLTTPVMRCIKEQIGGEIHYLTKDSFKSIVETNPYVDKVFAIKKDVNEVIPELKHNAYTAIIDLHKNLRSLTVRRRVKGKYYSFNKLNWQKWLMVNFKWNYLPERHIVDRYMEAVKPLGVKNDGMGLDYFLPGAFETIEQGILEKLPDLKMDQSYVCLAIGAAHNTKRIPFEKVVELCNQIKSPVFILGGPKEKEEGEKIVSQSIGKVFNTAGHLSLHESAFLIKKAVLIISPDTGMMHIAAAFKKPIVSVWGSTIPEFGMYPYYPLGHQQNTTFEVPNLSCRPCSKIGFNTCPKGHFDCMERQDWGKLVEVVHQH